MRRYRLSPLWMGTLLLALLFMAGLLFGGFMQLPLYSLQPGPARDVTRLVSVRGERTYPTEGALLLTTVAVSSHPISLFERVAAAFDPATQLVERSAIIGPGLTDQEQDQLNMADMLQSKYAAAIVALDALGREVSRIPGVRIVYVFEKSPSFGKLRAGDVVVRVDGAAVPDAQSMSERIRAHKPGETVRIAVARPDGEREFVVRTKQSVDERGRARPIIGVSLAPAYRFPVNIQIDTQDIGGPSGGLVFALSIVEVLGEEDLTRGHVVAATGTIDLMGNVGEIGGIEQKVRAAEHSGADVFLVPSGEAAAAAKVARSIRVIGIGTFDEALSVLRALPERPR